jgi:hypothetical protein
VRKTEQLKEAGPNARLAKRRRAPDDAARRRLAAAPNYSHSIVPGGFDVMSRTTRFTCGISLIIRDAIRSSRS